MFLVFKVAVIMGAVILYLIPAIKADSLGQDDAIEITVVNLLLGWTVVGWFGALAWTRQPLSEKRLPHLTRRTQRAIARVTIDKLVAHSAKRMAAKAPVAGIHPVASGWSL